MAVPFRRTSITRKGKRRGPAILAFQKKSFSAQPLTKCFNCQKKKVLHQVCSYCLTYKNLNFWKPIKKQVEQEK